MDEISELRICPLQNSDLWGIRYQFKSGRVHIEGVGSLASAIASASRLRRPPTLRVIQGGRADPPSTLSTGAPRDSLSLIVK
jgi:hypothetical protein